MQAESAAAQPLLFAGTRSRDGVFFDLHALAVWAEGRAGWQLCAAVDAAVFIHPVPSSQRFHERKHILVSLFRRGHRAFLHDPPEPSGREPP